MFIDASLWALVQQNFSDQGGLTEESPFDAHRHTVLKRRSEVTLILWALVLEGQSLIAQPVLCSWQYIPQDRSWESPKCWVDYHSSISNLPSLSRLFAFLSNFFQGALVLNENVQPSPKWSKGGTWQKWVTSQSQIELPGVQIQSSSCTHGFVTPMKRKDYKKMCH